MVFENVSLRIVCAVFAFAYAVSCEELGGNFLDGNLDLADGVRLVSIPTDNGRTGRSHVFDGGKDTVLSRMAKFLQGHELQIKLPSIIEKEKLTHAFAESLKVIDETSKDSEVTGRKKGDGGAGSMIMMGLMMAKTLGALGIGGLGLLTMKALMVSALALMLSAIVGVKKLASGGGDDDGGHQVHYVDAGHGHHRRKRDIDDMDIPLPYKGWIDYMNTDKSE